MFPLDLFLAANGLGDRGYDYRPGMLDVMLRQGIIELAECDCCTRTDVELAVSSAVCKFRTPQCAKLSHTHAETSAVSSGGGRTRVREAWAGGPRRRPVVRVTSRSIWR